MPFLQRDDTKIFYEVHGEGPPLLLNAETACHGDYWKQHQVPAFEDAYSVVTYDQRGTGRSDPLIGELNCELLAADIAALLREIDRGPAVICGHSMGGRVAQVVALDYPQVVSKLILASTGAALKMAPGIPLHVAVAMVEQGFRNYMHDHIIKMSFTDEWVRDHPAELKEYMAMRLKDLPPVETVLRYILGRQALDIERRLKDIKVPTLVLVGDREDNLIADNMTHWDAAQVLANGIPGAIFTVLSGQRHCYFQTIPDEVNRIMRDFIASA